MSFFFTLVTLALCMLFVATLAQPTPSSLAGNPSPSPSASSSVSPASSPLAPSVSIPSPSSPEPPSSSTSAIPSQSPSPSSLLPSPNPSPSKSSAPLAVSPSPFPSSTVSGPSPVSFSDVTESVGIFQPQSDLFGGATIADVNNDGHYDLVLNYHNVHPMRLYFGTSSGKFIRSPFSLRADVHGICVGPHTTRSNDKILAVSVGGGRGTIQRPPFIYLVKPDNSITTITNEFGFGEKGGRGRVPVFMDMSMQSRRERIRNFGGPDVLFINLLGRNPDLTQFAYQNLKGNYSLKGVSGFSRVDEERAIVTDVNGDGIMELVHFSVLRIFKLVAPFTFQDITRSVWPGWRNLRRSVSAVVELDFNNDGRMDLYIARARSSLVTPRGPPSVPEHDDVLLMNRGGWYEEVSDSAGLPKNIDSMGVTAEDFNNDGYVDVLITTFEGPDILLFNQGDGTFKQFDPKTTKSASTRGANVMAVDYDLDGRVDYIAGQGLRKAFSGNYRLMKNMMALSSNTNYLLVRVGNERWRSCTSLNAIVIVRLSHTKRMVRRVGGRGAQMGGQSYLDTVHFGLGSAKVANHVIVKWTTGAVQSQRLVSANQLIKFGRFD